MWACIKAHKRHMLSATRKPETNISVQSLFNPYVYIQQCKHPCLMHNLISFFWGAGERIQNTRWPNKREPSVQHEPITYVSFFIFVCVNVRG